MLSTFIAYYYQSTAAYTRELSAYKMHERSRAYHPYVSRLHAISKPHPTSPILHPERCIHPSSQPAEIIYKILGITDCFSCPSGHTFLWPILQTSSKEISQLNHRWKKISKAYVEYLQHAPAMKAKTALTEVLIHAPLTCTWRHFRQSGKIYNDISWQQKEIYRRPMLRRNTTLFQVLTVT